MQTLSCFVPMCTNAAQGTLCCISAHQTLSSIGASATRCCEWGFPSLLEGCIPHAAQLIDMADCYCKGGVFITLPSQAAVEMRICQSAPHSPVLTYMLGAPVHTHQAGKAIRVVTKFDNGCLNARSVVPALSCHHLTVGQQAPVPTCIFVRIVSSLLSSKSLH